MTITLDLHLLNLIVFPLLAHHRGIVTFQSIQNLYQGVLSNDEQSPFLLPSPPKRNNKLIPPNNEVVYSSFLPDSEESPLANILPQFVYKIFEPNHLPTMGMSCYTGSTSQRRQVLRKFPFSDGRRTTKRYTFSSKQGKCLNKEEEVATPLMSSFPPLLFFIQGERILSKQLHFDFSFLYLLFNKDFSSREEEPLPCENQEELPPLLTYFLKEQSNVLIKKRNSGPSLRIKDRFKVRRGFSKPNFDSIGVLQVKSYINFKKLSPVPQINRIISPIRLNSFNHSFLELSKPSRSRYDHQVMTPVLPLMVRIHLSCF